MALILVTGSNGLIGSAAVDYFCSRGHHVYGLDNNMRMEFFSAEGDTMPTLQFLKAKHGERYVHHDTDIRNLSRVCDIMHQNKFSLVIHAAGQPSHDWAVRNPMLDWQVNATGTMNVLEATRHYAPDAVFVFLSTNKVYGDSPNKIQMKERKTRFEYADPLLWMGISEAMPIDECLHSIFGASKTAADLMVQEYGRYFGMLTCCLRCGCMTGPNHAGVELHGFLNYLVKCNVEERVYKIFGYHGKQVRDNIHAYDVISLIDQFWASPRRGAVYNMGGGQTHSCSILEAFDLVQEVSGKPMRSEYVNQARKGDHICYYTDLRRVCHDYKHWQITISLKEIIKQIHEHYAKRTSPSHSSHAG